MKLHSLKKKLRDKDSHFSVVKSATYLSSAEIMKLKKKLRIIHIWKQLSPKLEVSSAQNK